MQEVTAVVPAKDGKDAMKVTFEVDFGASLSDLVALVGEDVVYSNAKQDMVVSAQGRARALLKKGQTAEEVAVVMQTWKPGVKTVTGRAISQESMLKKAAKMTPAALQEYIAKLQAQAASMQE